MSPGEPGSLELVSALCVLSLSGVSSWPGTTAGAPTNAFTFLGSRKEAGARMLFHTFEKHGIHTHRFHLHLLGQNGVACPWRQAGNEAF